MKKPMKKIFIAIVSLPRLLVSLAVPRGASLSALIATRIIIILVIAALGYLPNASGATWNASTDYSSTSTLTI